MAGKNLLTKTSQKKKPTTKRKSKSGEYSFDLNDICTYLGDIIKGYSGQKVKVISRSRTFNAESYTIEFSDGQQLKTTKEILKAIGGIETETEVIITKFEVDIPFTESGEESLHNVGNCLVQTYFAHYNCDGCHLENRCVFHGKRDFKAYDLH